MLMSHEARVARIVEIIRTKTVPGWYEYHVPRIGKITVNCMPVELAKRWGNNECWVRLGTLEYHKDELRGSAEMVAKELCQKYLKAPSKAVRETADKVLAVNFDGFKPYELAAMHGLDTETTFKAMDYLAEAGLAVRKGDMGWFRTTD